MIDADRCSVNSDIAERESIAEQRAFRLNEFVPWTGIGLQTL